MGGISCGRICGGFRRPRGEGVGARATHQGARNEPPRVTESHIYSTT